MLGLLRRHLRMGIGGLMLAILLLGLLLGHWVNRAKEQARAVAAVKASGGWVRFADEFAMGPVNVPPGNALWKPGWGKLVPNKGPILPDRLRRWIGDEYFREVVHVSTFVDLQKLSASAPGLNRPPLDDMLRALENQRGIRTLQLGGDTLTGKGLASVAKLTDLRELFLWWAGGVDDAGVARIGHLPRLRVLDISLSPITDEGVGHLADLPALEELSLQGKKFTDRSLKHLARAKRLKLLFLRSDTSEFTDVGLEHLAGLKDLQQLGLQGASLTKEGREKLVKAIPGLLILP
ncbi:hypothetical protein P12x_000383 [Tundrisphaera lichenicola]|uniref:hypothetical protein n=1 Tax=Tundrisphaera lichenicola TaxID=2029860 RepID=UPI003EBE93F8